MVTILHINIFCLYVLAVVSVSMRYCIATLSSNKPNKPTCCRFTNHAAADVAA